MIERIKEQLFVWGSFLDREFFGTLGVYFTFVSALSLWAIFFFTHFEFIKDTEITVQQSIIGLRSDFLTMVFRIFTNLGGESSMIFLVLLVALVFFVKRQYLYSLGVVLSVGITEVVSIALKTLIGRGRPPASLSLAIEHSPSFPSGHTIVAVAFYGFLMYVIHKNIHHKLLRFFLMFFCGGMIILSGFARVYLGVHYPGDVIASYLFGAVWIILIIRLIERKES